LIGASAIGKKEGTMAEAVLAAVHPADRRIELRQFPRPAIGGRRGPEGDGPPGARPVSVGVLSWAAY
jgi:hypothetical protein